MVRVPFGEALDAALAGHMQDSLDGGDAASRAPYGGEGNCRATWRALVLRLG
jgi:hypothetical protein